GGRPLRYLGQNRGSGAITDVRRNARSGSLKNGASYSSPVADHPLRRFPIHLFHRRRQLRRPSKGDPHPKTIGFPTAFFTRPFAIKVNSCVHVCAIICTLFPVPSCKSFEISQFVGRNAALFSNRERQNHHWGTSDANIGWVGCVAFISASG